MYGENDGRVGLTLVAIGVVSVIAAVYYSLDVRSEPKAQPTAARTPTGTTINEWVDAETGCHYILIGDAITPRLNPYSKPMCPQADQRAVEPTKKPTAL